MATSRFLRDARRAAAVALGFAAADAQAGLLDGLGSPTYAEDFEGEISFPTTPELDALGFGGMDAFRSGDPLPLAPTISGGEMLIAVQEASPFVVALRGSGGSVPIAVEADARIGLAARFDGYETVQDPTYGQFQTAAVTLQDSTLGNGASGYLLEFGTGALRVAVSNLGPFLSGYDDVTLSSTAEAAIRAGDAFTVELLFDGAAATAQASVTVNAETFTTDAMTSSTYAAMDAIDAAIVVNTTTNNSPPIATIASDVKEFALHVPEPDAGAAALAVVATLAGLARRRTTR